MSFAKQWIEHAQVALCLSVGTHPTNEVQSLICWPAASGTSVASATPVLCLKVGISAATPFKRNAALLPRYVLPQQLSEGGLLLSRLLPWMPAVLVVGQLRWPGSVSVVVATLSPRCFVNHMLRLAVNTTLVVIQMNSHGT